MTGQELLDQMDARSRDLEFPVLDNANWDYAAGRVRGFRAGSRIAIVFELVIFQPGSLQFLIDTYAFGDLPSSPGGYGGSSTLLTEVEGHPLWNEDGTWIIPAPVRVVRLHDQLVLATEPGASADGIDHELAVTLSVGDGASEGDFALALARELGLRALIPDRLVAELIPELVHAPEVARLSGWDHPNVARGELPSASGALRALAGFLTGERAELSHDRRRDNSDRRHWSVRE